MSDYIIWLELIVGLSVSFTLLGIFIWGVRKGMFDDEYKIMQSPLFDSTKDLQDAIKKEKRIQTLKEKKKKGNTKV